MRLIARSRVPKDVFDQLINELGVVSESVTKETKQDLMHVAICTLLSPLGYFVYEGKDDEGWPHWSPKKQMPTIELKEQEYLLKQQIIRYFGSL